ncbi:hypothetical protein ECEC1865_2797, partial [Escherichia coli EC1865]|jgi:hypothetical protein
MYPLN